MKVVVDTNIVFSALLNSNGSIGDLLFNSGKQFDFYSGGYMRHEIRKHWEKLKKLSKLTEEQLQMGPVRKFKVVELISKAASSKRIRQ